MNAVELFSILDNRYFITKKNFFHGQGFFIDGMIFGLEVGNVFYLKGSGELEKKMRSLNLPPLIINRKGKVVISKYYQLPDNDGHNMALIKSITTKAIADTQKRSKEKSDALKNMPNSLHKLKNMKGSTIKMLKKIGVNDYQSLKQRGSVSVYNQIKQELNEHVSERLLFRLEGAIVDLDWMWLSEESKIQLRECLAND
ncbi:TfoX/Sxy family DNA transformation protein [Vibrio vulnificus]|nr:TfoX/Sxy family DNA transformation protein [Vibrio vulnificus]ELR8772619.1 TfoX/Sxy family DNA transformation protein [Vibrio vulnificus]